MKRLIKKSKQEADKGSWQYQALEAAGFNMKRAEPADRSGGSFYDVTGGDLKGHGYKSIKTNSQDYTAGFYTNGENVIMITTTQSKYVSIYKLGVNAKKFLDENPGKAFNIINDSLQQ
jgi:hypothetical protein